MKFNHEARGEIAVKLWEAGALPRVHWRGAQVCEGVSLEWRVLFFGEHLKTEGVAVPDDVTLIMPPEPGNAVEVLVSLGLPDKPIPRLSYCIELDSGRLCDGRGVAVAWQSWPVKRSAAVMTSSNPVGRGYVAEAALRSTPPEELRAVGIGEQSDGSLALFDLRATTPKERE
jgi:hypothetical protein